MQTVYYKLMLLRAAVLLFAAAALVCAQDHEVTHSAARPDAARPAVSDSHEGMTIGIEPWTQASRYKEKFPKKSPFAKGIVAMHIRFRNDSDHGVRVNLQSIRL